MPAVMVGLMQEFLRMLDDVQQMNCEPFRELEACYDIYSKMRLKVMETQMKATITSPHQRLHCDALSIRLLQSLDTIWYLKSGESTSFVPPPPWELVLFLSSYCSEVLMWQIKGGQPQAVIPIRPSRNPHRDITTAQIGEPFGLNERQAWQKLQSCLDEIKMRLPEVRLVYELN